MYFRIFQTYILKVNRLYKCLFKSCFSVDTKAYSSTSIIKEKQMDIYSLVILVRRRIAKCLRGHVPPKVNALVVPHVETALGCCKNNPVYWASTSLLGMYVMPLVPQTAVMKACSEMLDGKGVKKLPVTSPLNVYFSNEQRNLLYKIAKCKVGFFEQQDLLQNSAAKECLFGVELCNQTYDHTDLYRSHSDHMSVKMYRGEWTYGLMPIQCGRNVALFHKRCGVQDIDAEYMGIKDLMSKYYWLINYKDEMVYRQMAKRLEAMKEAAKVTA